MTEFTYLIKEDGYRNYVVSKFYFGEPIPVQQYRVNGESKRWKCTCPHNTYRKVQCKHIKYVKTYLKTNENEFEV